VLKHAGNPIPYMKFNITSGELVKALSAVAGVVPSKATLPILENVLFESVDGALKLTATDNEIYIVEQVSAEIIQDGSVAIPARRLLDTMRQLPDIPLSFDIDDRCIVKFRTDRGAYKLVGAKAEDFPMLPSVNEGTTIVVNTESLTAGIEKTRFAVSTDDLRPNMMGVYFQVDEEKTRLVATDGHRLVRLVKHDMKGDVPINFIVPDKALAQVTRTLSGGETKMQITKHHVRFTNGDAEVVARLINESYPNYENVIPKENEKIMTVAKDDMLATVRRVSIFSSSTTRQIRLNLSQDEVSIFAEDYEMSSEARESIKCQYDADDMVIGFNARYLADVLHNITGDEVTFAFSTPNRAGIVQPVEQAADEDLLMLIMPVMLNTQG
jgi:DNA polymerase III subunit beta